MIGAGVYKRSLPQNNRENAIRRNATTFAKAKPRITPTSSFTDIANSAGKYIATAGNNAGKYGAMDVSGQTNLSDDILDKTTPDVAGIGFTNTYQDGKFSSTLNEMEKGIYDQTGMLTDILGKQAQDFFSSGYEGMRRNRYDEAMSLFATDRAREEAERRARQLATGASSTGIQLEDANVAQNIAQQNLQTLAGIDQDVMNFGNFLTGNRNQNIDAMLAQGSAGNTMLANQLSKLDATTNFQNQSDAITAQYDQMAAAEQAKRKSKSSFWGNIFEFGLNTVMPGAGTAAKGLFG